MVSLANLCIERIIMEMLSAAGGVQVPYRCSARVLGLMLISLGELIGNYQNDLIL